MHRNVNSAMYKEYTQKIFIQARSRVFKYLWNILYLYLNTVTHALFEAQFQYF